MIVGWNSNEIHKWAHQGNRERATVGTWLQKSGLIQTPRQHQEHHSGNKDNNYCPVSPFMNPILDGLDFWRKLEKVVYYFAGFKTVAEETVPGSISRPQKIKFTCKRYWS